jgi:glucose-6-phosphate isomerase, archaeal
MLPFQLDLTPESFRAFPGAQPMQRRLADVAGIFGDQAAVEQARSQNPLIYEFVDLRASLPGSHLSFGLTTILPGAIGGEYFMTKGHFHAAQQDGDEIYLVVSGQGLLQLQSRTGEGRDLPLKAGGMLYTPLAWAHRSINTGPEPLVFFSIWPSDTAYDYEEITRRGGFPTRAVQHSGRSALVPNPLFKVE